MEEVVKSLLATNQALTAQLIDSNKTLAAAVAALAKTRPAEAQTPEEEVEWASFPLGVSESEEDAKHLLDIGAIDKAEYEDMLRAAGLPNTEIHFDIP